MLKVHWIFKILEIFFRVSVITPYFLFFLLYFSLISI